MQCRICKKHLTRKDLADEDGTPKKAVYHESFGLACLHHHGVQEHFEDLWKRANVKTAKNGEGRPQ